MIRPAGRQAAACRGDRARPGCCATWPHSGAARIPPKSSAAAPSAVSCHAGASPRSTAPTLPRPHRRKSGFRLHSPCLQHRKPSQALTGPTPPCGMPSLARHLPWRLEPPRLGRSHTQAANTSVQSERQPDSMRTVLVNSVSDMPITRFIDVRAQGLPVDGAQLA